MIFYKFYNFSYNFYNIPRNAVKNKFAFCGFDVMLGTNKIRVSTA
jgi:hypothetical protein